MPYYNSTSLASVRAVQRSLIRSKLVRAMFFVSAASLAARGALAWVVHPASQQLTSLSIKTCRSPSGNVIAHSSLARYPFVFVGRLASSLTGPDEDDPTTEETPKQPPQKQTKKKPSPKKFKVVDKIKKKHIDKLAAAFDELARKEGFDESDAYYADDASFEEYDDDDDEDDKFVAIVKDELDDGDDGGNGQDQREVLDSSQFDMNDFEENDDEEQEIDDDLFFGIDGDDDDMDSRIAAAQRDVSRGRVTVPANLDDISPEDLKRLGYRTERNPFGNDETPRRERFKIIVDAMQCSACGSDFQCQHKSRPGYLPPEKFDIQVKLHKLEEVQKLQEKAESDEWTPEDEIEWLIQTSGSKQPDDAVDSEIDIQTMANEMGINLLAASKKKMICKRCHGLQNFGKVEESLRPGWTSEPLLSQDQFRNLLRPIRENPAVIIALVDLFDFSGSVLPELDNIAGENPVIVAANKVDLLPSKMGPVRAENWVRRELEYHGIRSLANIGGAVRLVSCKTGFGVGAMLAKARSLAEEMDCPIYLVGAANAGKSTLLNYVIASQSREDKETIQRKRRAGNQNQIKGAVTTSPLPGTTLKFIKVDLGDGRLLYDTPGLLVPGALTQLLTPEELKIVVPKK